MPSLSHHIGQGFLTWAIDQLKTHPEITAFKETLMASVEEFRARLDAATDEVASDLKDVRDELEALRNAPQADVEAAVAAALDSLNPSISRLEEMGKDAADPAPIDGEAPVPLPAEPTEPAPTEPAPSEPAETPATPEPLPGESTVPVDDPSQLPDDGEPEAPTWGGNNPQPDGGSNTDEAASPTGADAEPGQPIVAGEPTDSASRTL